MAVDNNKAVIRADVIEYYSSLYPTATEEQLEFIIPQFQYTPDRCLPDTCGLNTIAIANIITGNVISSYYVFVKEEHQNMIPLGETNEGKLVTYSSMLPKITTHSIDIYVNVALYHMDGKTSVSESSLKGISIVNNVGTITCADGWSLVSSPSMMKLFKQIAIIGKTPDDNVVLMSHTPTKIYNFTDMDGVSYYYPSALNNLTLISGSSATAPTKTVDTSQQKIVFTKPNKITINGSEDTTTYAYKLNSIFMDGYINLVNMLPSTGTSTGTGSGAILIRNVRLETTIAPNVDMTVVVSDTLNRTFTFNIEAGKGYSQTITNWSGGNQFSISSYGATNSGDTLIYGYRKGSSPMQGVS